MSEFTVVPGMNRWYFHAPGRTQFGDASGISGYAEAGFSFQQESQAVVIVSQPRGKTAVVGTTAELQVSAVGYPLHYQWLRNGAPMPGETGFRLSLSSVKMSDAGLYSVIVSNRLGMQTSAGALLRVVPPVSVAVFDDPNYVDTSFGGIYSESDCVQGPYRCWDIMSRRCRLWLRHSAGSAVFLRAYGNPAPALDSATRRASFVLTAICWWFGRIGGAIRERHFGSVRRDLEDPRSCSLEGAGGPSWMGLMLRQFDDPCPGHPFAAGGAQPFTAQMVSAGVAIAAEQQPSDLSGWN
jgi:hypothetical protein